MLMASDELNLQKLKKDLIVLFLKSNELEMEEIDIWESILKWALERMSTQHNVDNLSRWTSRRNQFDIFNRVTGDNNYQIYAVCYHLNYEPAFGVDDIIKTYGSK
ncbi:hypothetical protein C1646_749983 [Rhizophagus diaphanus]|nr:hypothetical protein C1646_749983 [Rhizophagus diaphanus] [Rhizophagus sp. MUCL 43196]